MSVTDHKRFLREDEGAVTVDWVVLTAAIVGMVVAVFTVITKQSVTVGANIVDNALEEVARYRPTFGSTEEVGVPPVE